MISEWLEEGSILAIRPDGPIDEADFEAVGALIDPVIAGSGRLNGLLIDARGFAGWDDAHALLTHLRFVHQHQDKVGRIAVIGEQWWLQAAPMSELFYGAPIRLFGDDEAAAVDWLRDGANAPPDVTVLPESDGPLVGMRVTGRLRDADYKKLKAELEGRLSPGGKLRLLIAFDDNFRGWTPKACLDDFSMAFSPWLSRFEKIAIVSGPGLVRWSIAHFPDGLLPYEMKVFSEDEIDAAWAWLKA